MKRKFSRTGYKKTSPDKNNTSNTIPSNKITMKNVDKSILGLGLDENGNLTGMKFMDPDVEEYDFTPASSVFEIPKYQLGGPQPNFFNSPLEQTTQQKQDARGQSNPFDVSGLTLPDFNTFMTNPTALAQTAPMETMPMETQANPNLSGISDEADQFDMQQNAIEQGNFANSLPQNSQLDEATLKNEANKVLNEDSDYNNQQSLDAPDKFQFFNPYAGVDIPSAGVALGQSIESGNTLGTIASGLKIATGLGRNIVGGIGQQRRNQFAIDEYNDKQREGLTKATYQQGGSMLNDQDVENINNSIDGVDFNPGMVRSLFEKTQPMEKPSIYQPNLGKYGKAGYFNVDNVQGEDIMLSTTAKNPHNRSTIDQLLPYLKEQNPGKNVRINFQDGGQVEEEEILTGEYSGEDAGNINAEIEKGEYRNDGQGNVTEVKGKTHEQGGVDVNMGPEEKILSDHTKLGGDTAKMFKKDFDLDVSAKDTYSTVLDKFKKKSGLSKITEEMEELIEKVDKETKKKDGSTKEMNMQFLSKKINELQAKKEPLEKAKEMLFNKVYDIQESKKPKEDTQEGMFKVGGNMYSEKQIMEYGGQFNIDPERAKELVMKLQEGGFGPNGVAKSLPPGQSKDEAGFYGGITQEQLSGTMVSNPWFDWNSFDPSNPTDVLKFQQEFNKRSQEGKNIKEDGKFGIQTQSVRLPFDSNGNVILQDNTLSAPLLDKTIPDPGFPESNYKEEKNGENLGMLLLPDQNPILPSTLQPVLKNERRYGRLDPTMIDPTQELSEIDRSSLSAVDSLNGLPDAQRQAVLAQISANTQDSASKTISTTNRANQQAQQQADAFNIRQGDREVDAAASDALSYEQRMLTGLSNTENDIRDFFEKTQELNMQNFNTVNELNYLNALNDKFQFDGTGFQQTGKSPTKEEMLNQIRLAQATTKMKYGGKRKKW